ncbi:MAG: MBOAT family protein [Xanthomonadales bacterium]|nr:MBOAT family protein [Xanthomonadales bacterium]
MQFDSFTFLIFFAIVLGGYSLLRSWGARKNWLLGASYLFYAAWNPPFVLLLIATSSIDYWAAMRMGASSGRIRRRFLIGVMLIHLGVLSYFKYSGFLLENLESLLAGFGVVWKAPAQDIILPVGISFYTFHSLSYLIDVYRRRIEPTSSWRDYALYVAFFPQLVAGPIVRWTQMGEQIEQPRRMSAAGLGLGFSLLTLGLFEKVVLADVVFAPVADTVFGADAAVSTADAWLGMLAFSGQIFCDFAGYSSCALGAALCLGFVLPVNFRNPYAAIGFSDFWRRWHISLSTWLRDYLYIPLGGNRLGRWLTLRNLMLTMLIGGLWHGAAWTFVAWGGLHGIYLVIERSLRKRFGLPDDRSASRVARLSYAAVTLLGVLYAWVWFRAADFEQGWQMTLGLVGASGIHPATITAGFDARIVVLAFLGLTATHFRWRAIDAKDVLQHLPAWVLVPLLTAMLSLIIMSPGQSHAFIYFQF